MRSLTPQPQPVGAIRLSYKSYKSASKYVQFVTVQDFPRRNNFTLLFLKGTDLVCATQVCGRRGRLSFNVLGTNGILMHSTTCLPDTAGDGRTRTGPGAGNLRPSCAALSSGGGEADADGRRTGVGGHGRARGEEPIGKMQQRRNCCCCFEVGQSDANQDMYP